MKILRGSILALLVSCWSAATSNSVLGQVLSMEAPSGTVPAGSGTWTPIYQPAPGAVPQMPVPVARFANPAMQPAAYAAYPGYMPGAVNPYWGVQPANYQPPEFLPEAGGTPMTGGPMPVDYGYGSAGGYVDSGYADAGCTDCGGHGCDSCSAHGIYGGLLSRAIARLLPYGEGGPCAPRWYDIQIDALNLTRDRASRRVDFAAEGINGDIILSTDDLNFDPTLGGRFTAALQVFAGSNFEFTYFGLFNFSDSAVTPATQFPDDIFSVISNFGINPFGGFDETDRSSSQSIAYSSTIDNFELNMRKRFTGPNCRVQYSWLAGFRYLYLLEDFNYTTIGGDDDLVTPGLQTRGTATFDTQTRNSLTGFQVGADVWTNVIPGISLGVDAKIGVYGNYANQSTNIVATTTNPAQTQTFLESVDGNDLAFVGDANLTMIYRLGPHWTARFGYSMMFVDGVALAPENFNATPPNILTTGGGFAFPPRNATINDNGNAFYHGGFAGFEWMW